jgi:RimJ/RimL family protein N-acetyltransferase
MHELRPLTPDDANEFWLFRLAGLEESPQAFLESADELRATPIDVTAQRLRASSDDNFVLGAFDGGRLIGTVGFFRIQGDKTRHKGRIWGVYVDPAFRRRGLAGEMMRATLARIGAVKNLHQVSLTVATTQLAARALYESLGFKAIGVEARSLAIGNTYVDEEHRVLLLD